MAFGARRRHSNSWRQSQFARFFCFLSFPLPLEPLLHQPPHHHTHSLTTHSTLNTPHCSDTHWPTGTEQQSQQSPCSSSREMDERRMSDQHTQSQQRAPPRQCSAQAGAKCASQSSAACAWRVAMRACGWRSAALCCAVALGGWHACGPVELARESHLTVPSFPFSSPCLQVHFDKITSRISRLCYNLAEFVDPIMVSQKVIQGLYKGQPLTHSSSSTQSQPPACQPTQHSLRYPIRYRLRATQV